MGPCAVYINEAALASAPRSGFQRRQVLEFVASLGGNPFTHGDFPRQMAQAGLFR